MVNNEAQASQLVTMTIYLGISKAAVQQSTPDAHLHALRFCNKSSCVHKNEWRYDGWVYLSDLEPPLVGNGALEVCPPLLSERGAPHMVHMRAVLP